MTATATALEAAFARLAQPRNTGFATKPRMLASKRAFDAINARDRARRRAMVKPENAGTILAALPVQPGDTLHAITPGNFIFGDLLTGIARQRRAAALYISTLSLSKKNTDDLAALLPANCTSITILVSNYFAKTNTEIFAHLEKRAAETPGMKVGVSRTHAKVALFDFGDGKLTLETSANLRSSDNIEQLSIFADPALYDFHREWIEELTA